MDKPEFNQEQLIYLRSILAIEPCHISGTHEPNHHLNGTICNFQRGDAWKRAMTALGFDPEEPERKLHDNCYWCGGTDSDLHQAWLIDVLRPVPWFNNPKVVHREVWCLAEIPGLNIYDRANLKQFLRARGFPAPTDCDMKTCQKRVVHWCPGRCPIAMEKLR